MRIRRTYATFVLAAAALLAAFAAPSAIAADLTDVGYLDQAAVAALSPFAQANASLAKYKAQLDPQFAAAMKGAKSDADRQRIAASFQQRLDNRRRAMLGPLLARVQAAIAQVSSNRNLSVVVDKTVVIYGGQNITPGVIALFKGPGPVVPPTNTPPPSEIGFVDQSQIDGMPKLKNANDTFLKFARSQQQRAMSAMAKAKNDPKAQQTILKNYQKSLADEQNSVLKPLVTQTKNAMADVARKKNLILVIDRTDIVYGGTDITSDVQNELK